MKEEEAKNVNKEIKEGGVVVNGDEVDSTWGGKHRMQYCVQMTYYIKKCIPET